MISTMMKKIIAALAVCICLAVIFCSCSSDSAEPTEDGAMTAVTDADGNVSGYERRYHNADGNLSRLDIYDPNQQYLSFVLYGYDDEGRLTTETYYLANGIAQSRTVYSYDDSGKLSEKAYEYPTGEATVERYDADGNVIEKLYYGKDEKLSYREVLEDGEWKTYLPEDSPEASPDESK